MKKQELIDALKMVIEALENSDSPKAVETVAEPTAEPEKVETKSTSNVEVELNDLKQMKYADLKKLASEMGVSAKGKRDEIIARIMSEDVDVSVVENDIKEVVEEPDNVLHFPKQDVDYLALAQEATEGMSLDEIREILEEFDLDSEGKKKTLIDRIAKAMEDGIIEVVDDDEDDEEETEEVDEYEDEDEDDSEDDDDEEDDDEDDDEEEEIDENSYFEDFDDGTNDPDDVDSDERAKAMVKLQKEIIDDYENEALQDSDIEDFLKKALTEDELEDLEDADEMDMFMTYCELMKRMINDEGERVPMGEPYEITVDGEVYDYCCGHELEETDDGYVCEVCGATYEAE